ncbi:RCC1/BLIP-II [Xylariomycetidae sp. FL0641]|nr:RCC1/BLIP-II [Xylariomycetidae sp. FL0641]
MPPRKAASAAAGVRKNAAPAKKAATKKAATNNTRADKTKKAAAPAASAKVNGTKAKEASKSVSRSASPAASAKSDSSSSKSATKKRARDDEGDEEMVDAPEPAAPRAKKAKTTHQRPAAAARAKPAAAAKPTPVINEQPSQVLDVLVFGEGAFGELGLGSKKVDNKRPTNVKRPRLNHQLLADKVGVVDIACGGMHAIALTKHNKVLTWGVNDEKALGRETNWDGGDDESDDDDDDVGLDPTESTPTEVDLSLLKNKEKVVQVAATNSASFILTDIGTVYGWGTFRGSDGVFGFSEEVKIQDKPTQVSGLQNITALAAGSNHMLALDKDGKVFTWGVSEQFQLGRKPVTRHGGPRASLNPMVCDRFTKKHHAVKISAGAYHSFYIDNQGRVHSWGLNNFSQTGHVDAGGKDNAMVAAPKIVQSLRNHNITRVDGGEHHSVACTEAHEVFTWGRVDGHQVGLTKEAFTEENAIFDENGKARIVVQPTKIPDLKAVWVASCSDSTLAVTPEGDAYSWGFSANFQTGLATQDDVEVPTKMLGADLKERKLTWAGCGGQYGMLAAHHKST